MNERNANTGLIKLKGNHYVSKNDPEFFQKLLQANPSLQKAFEENGTQLPPVKEDSIAEIEEQPVNTIEEKQKKPESMKTMITIIAILLILITTLIGLLWQSTGDVQAESSVSQSISKEEQLQLSLLRSGIESFKRTNGSLPTSLTSLIKHSPDNILSVIPSGHTYTTNESDDYALFPNSLDKDCVCKFEILKLAFYPETNELALLQGEEVVKVYPVASGKDGRELPFKKSQVTKRVVDPNGGNGVYGTRGIALTDNYAIHGTNQEELIGENVSNGCLRMKKEDIEELFPYVTLGMAFEVKEGEPEQEQFPKGLPPLGVSANKQKESTPQIIYHWNH